MKPTAVKPAAAKPAVAESAAQSRAEAVQQAKAVLAKAKRQTPPQTEDAKTIASDSDLVSWEEGIGDDKTFHIAHITSSGITLVLKMKDHKEWKQLVATAHNQQPQAASMLQEHDKASFFTSQQICKATYAQDLKQLTLFQQDGTKTKIPKGQEQADIFFAIRQHLGGTESEEEAVAWSVMQSPLFILAVIAVIGGFGIWFTTICNPEYEASGRRSGMKKLLNSIGYAVGPLWSSVAVGSLAALVLAMMIKQLVKRPIRQVLEY
ncbi:MAG: hypothetical protein ABJZ55_21050 [Fuerstiella sp.]